MSESEAAVVFERIRATWPSLRAALRQVWVNGLADLNFARVTEVLDGWKSETRPEIGDLQRKCGAPKRQEGPRSGCARCRGTGAIDVLIREPAPEGGYRVIATTAARCACPAGTGYLGLPPVGEFHRQRRPGTEVIEFPTIAERRGGVSPASVPAPETQPNHW